MKNVAVLCMCLKCFHLIYQGVRSQALIWLGENSAAAAAPTLLESPGSVSSRQGHCLVVHSYFCGDCRPSRLERGSGNDGLVLMIRQQFPGSVKAPVGHLLLWQGSEAPPREASGLEALLFVVGLHKHFLCGYFFHWNKNKNDILFWLYI